MVEGEALVVVGIDPGIARTGFGIVRLTEVGQLETIDYGVIETPAGQPLGKRLQQLYRELRTLLLLHKPSSGVVEKLFFQRNLRTAMVVGQARGRGVAMWRWQSPIWKWLNIHPERSNRPSLDMGRQEKSRCSRW